MALNIFTITIDCADAHELAKFWSAATGKKITFDNPGVDALIATAPSIYLQQVPEPKQGKNRVHIDFTTKDHRGEVKRLEGLGAKILWEIDEPGSRWTVMADPEGNEFDVNPA